MKNIVQEYAWGSYTAIAELLGNKSPSDKPQAELWMGAHPKAPSMIKYGDRWISLLKLIEKYPEDILGKAMARKYDNRLPYLFKVLAARKPLSIQAHPNLAQAREGFKRENILGVPLNAPNRNYKDNNHKPECICALTTFWALNGFRKISDILSLMRKISLKGLGTELDELQKYHDSKGLKRFFNALMTMDQERQKKVIEDALKNAQMLSEDDPAFRWMTNLHNDYPADIGVFSPILLNLICLKPGQAMFLPAGELHAYLDGVGIELMANSDNVLRGGLTPKHVDVPELLRTLNFEEKKVNILVPKKISDTERVYSSLAEEFVLSVIAVKKGLNHTSPINKSVEIILCTNGEATLTDIDNNDKVAMTRGISVMIPAAVKTYSIKGNATLYKAAVPV